MKLWNRKFEVSVETIKITNLDPTDPTKTGLDVAFNVTKTLKKEPNTIDLTIYNLNEKHRNELAQIENPIVQVKAGYEDEMSLIFSGGVRGAFSYLDGVDWVTELHSGDAEDQLKNSRINKSYKKGTKLSTIINDVVDELGVGRGNIDTIALNPFVEYLEGGNETLNGMVISGSCRDQLDWLLVSMGYEWSVQDGDIQVVENNKPIPGTAEVLSPSTGLIGSPRIGSEGLLNVTALMNGKIVPGSTIAIESDQIAKAFYRAERCDYIGDIAANDWYINIEAKELIGLT
jgi:hypothetical protein